MRGFSNPFQPDLGREYRLLKHTSRLKLLLVAIIFVSVGSKSSYDPLSIRTLQPSPYRYTAKQMIPQTHVKAHASSIWMHLTSRHASPYPGTIRHQCSRMLRKNDP